ncbi:MAG: DUF3574 domain-containing protein [Gammaproteobacteria bacterium]|nr:DUF3574 domain-containing protein [Gammaproteobacteria bacterium]
MKPLAGLGVLVGTLAVMGCTATPPAVSAVDCGGMQSALRSELFFGMTHRRGAAIAEADWEDFLANSVTARFPDGLSVIEARGQWRNPGTGALVRQPARVLLIIHPDDARSDASLEALREDYKARFDQISVLRVTQPVCMAF